MGAAPLRARLERPGAPFVGIIALAFAAAALGSSVTDWQLVLATGCGAAVLAVAAVLLPWSRVSP